MALFGKKKPVIAIDENTKFVATTHSFSKSTHEVSVLDLLKHLLHGEEKPAPVVTNDSGSHSTYEIHS